MASSIRPVNPCHYKGAHSPHDWYRDRYAFHCRGLDDLDVGATARQAELVAEREMVQAMMPVVNEDGG